MSSRQAAVSALSSSVKEDDALFSHALQAEFRALLYQDVEATLLRMRNASGKIVLNSDDLFGMLPQYAQHPEQRMILGPLLYPVAAEFTDATYARLLALPAGEENTIVFTAGGSATGKSSILRAAGKSPGVSFIVDTTFSTVSRAVAQVASALGSDRKVEIHYVYRDFRASVIGMVRRALDPVSGRIVPIDSMARTHHGSQRAVLEIWERYGADPRVAVRLKENVEGSLREITEQTFHVRLHASVDALQDLGQNVLDELREDRDRRRTDGFEDHDAGGARLPFTEAFYEAARSKAKSGGAKASSGDEGRLPESSKAR